jgi:phenylalanyl-tRNA synthetase alpha chain
MSTAIESLLKQALSDIQNAATLDALETLRVGLLGKSGSITGQLKTLGALPADERKQAGEVINSAKDQVADALTARKSVLEDAMFDR